MSFEQASLISSFKKIPQKLLKYISLMGTEIVVPKEKSTNLTNLTSNNKKIMLFNSHKSKKFSNIIFLAQRPPKNVILRVK